MRHAIEVSLSYPDAETAGRIADSLHPEVGDIEGNRTVVDLARTGETIDISVESGDLVGLRAGLNTWLSLASVAERAGGLGEDASTG